MDISFQFDKLFDCQKSGWQLEIDSNLVDHISILADFDNLDNPDISYFYTTTGHLVAIRPNSDNPDQLVDIKILAYRTNY